MSLFAMRRFAVSEWLKHFELQVWTDNRSINTDLPWNSTFGKGGAVFEATYPLRNEWGDEGHMILYPHVWVRYAWPTGSPDYESYNFYDIGLADDYPAADTPGHVCRYILVHGIKDGVANHTMVREGEYSCTLYDETNQDSVGRAAAPTLGACAMALGSAVLLRRRSRP